VLSFSLSLIANASLDEVMMRLIQGYEVFEQTKIVEVKSEVFTYFSSAFIHNVQEI